VRVLLQNNRIDFYQQEVAMKNVIAAALMSIAFTLSPLCAQEKKDAPMKGPMEGMSMQGDAMHSGAMDMNKMKEMHNKMIEMKKGMGGMTKGQGMMKSEEMKGAGGMMGDMSGMMGNMGQMMSTEFELDRLDVNSLNQLQQ